MKAVVVTSFDGPAGLKLQDVPEPVAGAGETLVDVEAVGVNFADVLAAKGKYPGSPQPPFISGREFAGTTSDGRKVMGYLQHSAAAERLSVAEGFYWPQPEGWSATQAAAFPVNFFTAWLLYWKSGLLPESIEPHPNRGGKSRVLIHAAAGGVGTACVQLGKIFGIETIGTASSPEKIAKLRDLGLNHAINYANEDFEQRVREITEAKGVDAVFDSVGGEHTAKSLRSVGDYGRVILFGTSSGERPKFDTMALYSRAASAHGLWLSMLSHHRALLGQALDSMMPSIKSGALRPVIGAKFPFSAAADAHRLLLERKNFGKVVLTIR